MFYFSFSNISSKGVICFLIIYMEVKDLQFSVQPLRVKWFCFVVCECYMSYSYRAHELKREQIIYQLQICTVIQQ